MHTDILPDDLTSLYTSPRREVISQRYRGKHISPCINLEERHICSFVKTQYLSNRIYSSLFRGNKHNTILWIQLSC